MEGYLLYIIISLPALLLGLWAQAKVKGAYRKYAQVRSSTGFTGAQVARRILDTNGLHDVPVEETGGILSDHYDPAKRVLRLSPAVYRTNSIAAAGIAAHEAGHALQHREQYFMLSLRSAMVPTVQIGSWLGPIIFIVGLFLSTTIAWIGLALFAGTSLFALVTLPVEFDATRRAKEWLANSGLVYQGEMVGVHKVLDAAALTYVAAAAQSISTLLYYGLMLVGARDN